MGAPAGRSDTAYRLINFAQFFDARLRDSAIFGYRRNSRIASLGGARGFGYRRVLRSGRAGPTSRGRAKLRFAVAASTPVLRSARLGKSCQNTQASFDDFPL